VCVYFIIDTLNILYINRTADPLTHSARFLRPTAYYVVTRSPCLHSRSETRAGK